MSPDGCQVAVLEVKRDPSVVFTEQEAKSLEDL
jgi:hypothetical protein